MADRRIMVPDQMTRDVNRTYKDISGAIKSYRSELLHELDTEMIYRRPNLVEGEPDTSFSAYVDTLEVNLTGVYHFYQDMDDEHRANEARLEVARAERNAAHEEAHAGLGPAREIAESLFGVSYSHLLGFAPIETSNDVFADQLRTLAKYLEKPAGDVRALFPGFNVDIPALAAVIRAASSKVAERNVAEDDARRAAESTMLKRRDALSKFRNDSNATADSIKALFRFAGLHEYADRVERSVRRLPRADTESTTDGAVAEEDRPLEPTEATEATATEEAPVTETETAPTVPLLQIVPSDTPS
jgi:hypothetical protein